MNRILTALLSAIIFCSCNSITGSGNIITQIRNVHDFNGVKASGSIDIQMTNDSTQMVKVEADDNVIPYVITNVEDGLLNVHFKSNTSYNNTHVKVYVGAPSLNKMIVSGSGNIISKDTVRNGEQLDMTVSGSGDINALVDAPRITANIGGSGTIALQGRTRAFNCKISGSGDLRCSKLLSENTTATVSGSGTAHVFASVHLLANVNGSGDIYYNGNPSSPETHTSGSGSIQAEK